MTKKWIVLWCGWALFVVAQLLPAVVVDMGAWNNPDASFIPGWFCTGVVWPFYLSNALALASPLLMRLRKRYPGRAAGVCMAAPYIASCIGAIACFQMFLAIHAGYILWCLSFIVIGGAMLMSDNGDQLSTQPSLSS